MLQEGLTERNNYIALSAIASVVELGQVDGRFVDPKLLKDVDQQDLGEGRTAEIFGALSAIYDMPEVDPRDVAYAVRSHVIEEAEAARDFARTEGLGDPALPFVVKETSKAFFDKLAEYRRAA